ncbi:MAG: ChuX/HutX family heme-like substrate-binding protein [Minicystis sp.]
MDLKSRYTEYRAAHPRVHARDAAEALGVSEAELVATKCGETVTRLDDRYKEMFEAMPGLGVVKTMTRNPSAVLERWGAFERVEIDGAMGQVVGEEIDLRIFLRGFQRAFAVTEQAPSGMPRRSLQFFDTEGASIHKVYLEDRERLDVFEALVARHASPDQSTTEPVQATHAASEPERAVDRESFCAAWDAMKDTHEFFGLLRRFGVARTQAHRLAGPERAYSVTPSVLEQVLRRAAEDEVRIMIFVGNRGLIQIHSGLVHHVEDRAGWLNVLDPRLNLHVRPERVVEAWVVRKPTSDGIVTSLELFDARGDTVLLVFGYRKPRSEEDPRWRVLISGVSLAAPATAEAP